MQSSIFLSPLSHKQRVFINDNDKDLNNWICWLFVAKSSIWFCYWVFHDKSARRSQLTLMKKCFPSIKYTHKDTLHFLQRKTWYNREHTILNWIKKQVMCCHIEHFNYYITLSFNGHIDRKRKDNWKLLSDFLFSAALESFPLTRRVSVIMTMDKFIILAKHCPRSTLKFNC